MKTQNVCARGEAEEKDEEKAFLMFGYVSN